MLMHVFCEITGLGLVKAGFACQLFNNQVGCIDTHNVKLYDIPLSAIRYDKTCKPDTLTAKRANYIALCKGLGGSKLLWAAWCDYVARKRPYNWSNGSEVSIFYYECLTNEFKYSVPDLFDKSFEPAYNGQS